ncbi:MAG: M23 family peptidase [Candidatus Angelobacter sp. Gp1-AA117]|nr:MAG: M23 family peptidase [Candidatus Angelobacter sp. Gp1-AA117]
MKILIALIIILIVPIVLLTALSDTPVLTLPDSLTGIGQATPVTVHVSDPHGIRKAAAFIEQNGNRYNLWETGQPSHRLFWHRKVADGTFTFTAGAKNTPQLQDGKAKLIVEATSNDFRGKTVSAEREVMVVTRPPSVSVDSDQHYLYLGMADLVTFTVSGYATESGVRVGDQKFRSWPMPDNKPGQFSLFAFAWNMPPETEPVVYATNPGGNEARGHMVIQFPKNEQPRYRVRELQLDDKFIEKVVNELDPSGSGDMVARFVKINSEMRKENNKALSDLRQKTEPRFLWSQPFLQQPNSKVEANFADVRNYIYKGQKIDQQVHLGYDLSITQHVPVLASNDGKVVYAAPLGIYGNCIVVDHGYGLQSIYGHLSEIGVHEGDMVKRGQVMGKSGMTGMAGGDHIHFSMQLEGVQIDPKEWWDAHWIKDHVAKRVSLPGFTY